MKSSMIAAGLLLALSAAGARAQEVVRHKIPNSDFPIAQAVEVPAGKTTIYVSGAVPPVIDEAAPKNTVATSAKAVKLLKYRTGSRTASRTTAVTTRVFSIRDQRFLALLEACSPVRPKRRSRLW